MEYIQNEIEKEKSELEKKEWYNSIDKAIEILEKSGLWKDVLENLKIAKSIGYEKLQKAYEITNKDFVDNNEKALIELTNIFKQNGISLNEIENSNLIDKDKIIYYYKNNTNEYDLNEKIRIEKIKEIDNRLIENVNGMERYKSDILWYLVKPLTIKKMRFDNDKRMNEYKLNQIKEAIQNKQEIEIYGKTSYDVRFHYKPNENKAWYSEEFRNKGNGHYYIALNEKYALFMEDD